MKNHNFPFISINLITRRLQRGIGASYVSLSSQLTIRLRGRFSDVFIFIVNSGELCNATIVRHRLLHSVRFFQCERCRKSRFAFGPNFVYTSRTRASWCVPLITICLYIWKLCTRFKMINIRWFRNPDGSFADASLTPQTHGVTKFNRHELAIIHGFISSTTGGTWCIWSWMAQLLPHALWFMKIIKWIDFNFKLSSNFCLLC